MKRRCLAVLVALPALLAAGCSKRGDAGAPTDASASAAADAAADAAGTIIAPGLMVVSARIADFEARRTSRNVVVRKELAREVAGQLPLPDAERALRSLTLDEDPSVRGAAVADLLRLGYRVRREDLPQGHGDLGAELPKTLADARARIATGNGWAALYLGMMGEPADLELLARVPATSTFARASIAFARLALGDSKGGTAALEAVAALPRSGNWFYVEIALLALHRGGDPRALTDLVEYLSEIEASREANDVNHAKLTLRYLADSTGVWHDDARAWRAWLAATGKPARGLRTPPAP